MTTTADSSATDKVSAAVKSSAIVLSYKSGVISTASPVSDETTVRVIDKPFIGDIPVIFEIPKIPAPEIPVEVNPKPTSLNLSLNAFCSFLGNDW
ncbi:MAG: hypothetical protein SPLM_10700 [Spiroplasma phoeniceum]|uniref:hypothetical protein n=1 Tax=Spiroplasma phoeniceum TaxID=47835 RepID=UPI003133D56A